MANRKYRDQSASNGAKTNEVNIGSNAVDVPATRFQDEQHVVSAINQGDNSVPDTSYVRKKTEAKGAKLKQAVASEIITKAGGTGSSSDVIAPNAVGLQSMSFSGDAGTILGDVSGTPVLAKDIQGTTRFDKRNSDANKQLNYIASEQVVTAYDNIPALAEDPQAEVGYNGNPKLQAPRSTKTAGVSPADLLYERSLDEIRQDKFVFTSGQVVKQANVNYVDYPTRTLTKDDEGYWSRPAAGTSNYTLKRGNYSPRALKAVFKNDGDGVYLADFSFDVDDYSIDNADQDVVNRSAVNQLTDVNIAELTRQRLDSEAGSPTDAGFCPLGRSVDQPTQTVMLLHDMEAVAGATVGTAYRFANKSKSYYLNRAAKDGQDITGPALDALYGHLTGATSLEQLKTIVSTTTDAPFDDVAGCKAGSVMTLLKAFDSVTKYKTKADLVNQPRGLKLHLQTAANNLKPFKVSNTFGKAMNSADVFSTINRPYDPMSAVCITDNVRLVYPYNFNDMLKFTRSKYGAARDYSKGSTLFAYDYKAQAGTNSYVIKCGEPLLNGIAYFLEVMATSIWKALGGGSSVTLTIPTVHSTCHFSLWDYLICAATPYILYERTNTLKDILDYEVNHEYPFTDLVSVDEGAISHPTNYQMGDGTTPLVISQMLPASAISWTWPELFQHVDGNVILPFYFSEKSYSITGTGSDMVIQDNGSREFLTPVLRSGHRLDVVDDAQGLAPMDLMLSLDAMTVGPQGLGSVKGGVYKYSAAAEGIPYIREAAFDDLKLTYGKMHAIPRITGYVMNAYPGECVGYTSAAIKAGAYVTLVGSDTTFEATESSSFRARAYYAANVDKQGAILAKASQTLVRAQAFQQRWSEARATSVFTNNKASDFDLGLSLSDYITGTPSSLKAVENYTAFTPFTGSGTALFGLHKYIWTRISKLPFAVNPFDCAHDATIDPFDVAYMFNLAGFMSADYNEKEYNRRNAVQIQGYGFTTDPYIVESPILK